MAEEARVAAIPKAVFALTELRARAWAKECGFQEPITIGQPEVIAYPKEGFGIHVHVDGTLSGKPAMATARFSAEGDPRYWTVEGAKAV
jgi:hypothetical protein